MQDDIECKSDTAFTDHFGLKDAKFTYICRVVWRLHHIEDSIHLFNTLSPKILVLHIGGNDIIPNKTKGEVVADNIIQLGLKIRSVTDIETIVICGILYRAKGKYIKEEAEADNFNHHVARANKYLQVMTPLNPGLIFWRHKGLKNPGMPVLCKDGAHLNKHGQYKLYQSVRAAAIHAVAKVSLV